MTDPDGEEARAQAEVVAFLASGAWAGEPAEHVTTHLSHIFLAGDRVLKLKRARRLPFVDYSTAELRRFFCRREVEVNAPFAAPLYRGVVAVRRAPGGLDLVPEADAGEAAVDYAVEMRRFAPEHQLDRMVDRGAVDGALADALGDAVAGMHARVPVVRVRRAADRVDRVRRQLAEDLAAVPAAAPLADALARWAAEAGETLARHRALIDRRGRHGFVRRCHGDLHLSNICLWQGRPMPFDAIEFDEELGTIDVLHDLAFVLVDLRHRGRADLASRVLSRAIECTRDYSGLAVLPLFSSLRSMVRALTSALKDRDPAPYVDEAERALAGPPPPRLLAVAGLSGTGKTTVAHRIAPEVGAVVIRSDTVRKRLAGVSLDSHLPPTAYSEEMRTAVYRRMLLDARRALRAGWPVILDGTFMEAEWRAAAEAAADGAGVPFCGVWLEAPADTLLARVGARTGDASDADTAVVLAQAAAGPGDLNWPRVDASRGPYETAARAAAALRR